MSFYYELEKIKLLDFESFFSGITKNDIARVLSKTRITKEDYLTLLSPAAEPFLEEMARKSREITLNNFGKTIGLYTPIYLSNYCQNRCVYCGFNAKSKQLRKQLSFDELVKEAELIAQTGLKHVLILTGDNRKIASVEYIKGCIEILKKYFDSIAIEIYALTQDEYKYLYDAGSDSLTIYQETYNEELYKELHIKGPKTDFRFRLDAPERGALAGMHSVNIGALLGLDEFRREAFITGLHGEYLQDKFPAIELGVSFPRIRPMDGGFIPNYVISDRNLIQYITALRIFLPRAGITISTRESEAFRNNLLPLGVTKMSAGTTTTVGGHSNSEDDSKQFETSDKRGVPEMMESLRYYGYQPVFKDWENINP